MDPNKLTVNQLKKELKAAKVSTPKSGKKAVYVELYREHITPKKTPGSSSSRRSGGGSSGRGKGVARATVSKTRASGRLSGGRKAPKRPAGLSSTSEDSDSGSSSGLDSVSAMTVAQLRSALSAAGVEVPQTSLRKAGLIELYKAKVLNSKQRVTRKARSRRSIEAQKVWEMDDSGDEAEPPPARRGRAGGTLKSPNPRASSSNPFQSPPRGLRQRKGVAGPPTPILKTPQSKRKRGTGRSAVTFASNPVPSPELRFSPSAPPPAAAGTLPPGWHPPPDRAFIAPELTPGRSGGPPPSMSPSGSPPASPRTAYTASEGPSTRSYETIRDEIGWRRWIGFGAVVALLLIMTSWSTSEPFCDSPKPGAVAGGSPTSCQPCPPHGSCADGRLICDKGYIKAGSACVKNEKLVRAAHTMARRVMEHLAMQAGYQECGWNVSPSVPEAELQSLVRHLVPEADFTWTWDLMKTESLRGQKAWWDSLSVEKSQSGELWSTSVPSYPPLCSLKLWMLSHKLAMLGVVGIVVGWLTVRRRRSLQLAYDQEVERLYRAAVDALVARYQDGEAGRLSDGDASIPATHLRDHLIDSIDARKELLWEGVMGRIANDTRIKTSTSMFHGEAHDHWEWIAPLTPTSRSLNVSQASAGSGSASPITPHRLSFSGTSPQRPGPPVVPNPGPMFDPSIFSRIEALNAADRR